MYSSSSGSLSAMAVSSRGMQQPAGSNRYDRRAPLGGWRPRRTLVAGSVLWASLAAVVFWASEPEPSLGRRAAWAGPAQPPATSKRQRRRAIVRQAQENGAASPRWTEAVSADFAAEGHRCWSVAGDAPCPGFIANMLPIGKDYSKRADAMYVMGLPAEQTPWKVGRASPRAPESGREADFQRALGFLTAGGGITSQSVVLDLACGDAFFAKRLAESGNFGDVLAADISWPALQAARDDAEKQGFAADSIRFLQADMEALPFLEGSVDAVLWAMGLHMTRRPKASLRSVYNALKEGGRLFITCRPDLRGLETAEALEGLLGRLGFSEVNLRDESGVRYVVQAVKR
eukprot:TRINITY_DN49047_c0_g1_i1.p1 TRINITY_DN49047_c0_g1~~TRINITY_DN49047_c0_g1_i1.p1  ORF type:complete len:359 (+),score=69.62 TRINITY_DN49047_c0_g1_i1:44-1078(+)